jgi:NAD(P)-dependent dehydrogenase (short-subunit alcohol dehydrogenase family)
VTRLDDAARQAAGLEQRAHRPWPIPDGPWLLGQTWRRLLFAHWRGAIVNSTAGLAQLLRPRGIRVNSVLPGPVRTPLISATMPPDQVEGFGSDTPLGRPANRQNWHPSTS